METRIMFIKICRSVDLPWPAATKRFDPKDNGTSNREQKVSATITNHGRSRREKCKTLCVEDRRDGEQPIEWERLPLGPVLLYIV